MNDIDKLLKENKSFCVVLWSHIYIDANGTIKPCCRWKESHEDIITSKQFQSSQLLDMSLEEFYNHDFYKNFRQKMINGEKIIQCVRCYAHEGSTDNSHRLKHNKKYLKYLNLEKSQTNFDELRFLEIYFDNVCNLQCRMCSSFHSSKLYKRDELLQNKGFDYFPNKNKTFNYNILKEKKLSELKEIRILGGEPLLSDEHIPFLNMLVEKGISKNILLGYSTNCTIRPDQELLNLWKQFREIRFSFSIDGIYKINDYQRVGSKFEELIENIKYIIKAANIDDHNLHSTYTNYNLNYFSRNTKWFKENLNISNTTEIAWNKSFSPLIIPDDFKEFILEENDINDRDFLEKLLSKSRYDEKKWNDFLKTTKIKDNFHHLYLKDHNPSLYEFLCKNYNYESIKID